MKSIIVFILSLVLIGTASSQSYNKITGKQDFTDSIKFSKFLNSVGEDSVLTIDRVTKKLKFVLKGGGSGGSVDSCTSASNGFYYWKSGTPTLVVTPNNVYSFILNYDSTYQLIYKNSVLEDSIWLGVRNVFGINGIRVVDSINNVYIDGSSVSGTDSFAYRSDLRVWAADSTYYVDCSLKQCDTIYWTGGGGGSGSYVPYIGATSSPNLGEFGISEGFSQYDTTATTYTRNTGNIGWNDTDGTLEFNLKGNSVSLQIGQETVLRVVNKTGSNLLESQYLAVYVSGAQGQRVKVNLASANADSMSAKTIGVVTENINVNQEGFITTSGLVREINTTGSLQSETWADGDILYLSPTINGGLTNIKPTAPQHTVLMGYCVYAHAIHGSIFVKVVDGFKLDDLHNVNISTPLNNEALVYETATKLWKNKAPVDATKLNISDTASMLSPYKTSYPRQAISVTGSGGSYNNSTGVINLTGGSSSSNTVTEQKIYYRGEYYADKQINTTTGAVTSNTGTAITDYLHVAGSESITISVPNGYSNVVIYGWTYDTTFTAISEIRSNALIGTTLKTYTFTTPSNARFLNIYIKYGGLDFAKALSIKSTNTITYNTPITPEQFTGSKSVPIQKALDFARFTSTGVTLNGSYSIDSSLILSSGSTLILDNARIILDSGSHTNIIRNEAVENQAIIFARGNRDVKIIGIGNSSIEGSKEAWGTDNPTGVGTEQWRSIGIFFANVENFEVKGFTLKNTNSWGSCYEQCRLGLIDNLTIEQDSTHGNQDGINLRDGTNRVTVSNIKGYTWDDMIACTNLEIGPNIKILGTTIYQPYATNLDIHSIIIKNIQRDTTDFFSGIFSAIYKGGILLLCEDARRIHDVTIDGVTGPQQIQVGFTLANYVVTTPATVNDMYNIGVSNTGIANINFARPIKNSSFYNVADSTTGGALNAQYFAGSVNVARKAYQKGWEFYEIFGTQNLGSNTNVPVEIQTNNITRQAIKTDGKMAFGMASTTPTYNYQFEAVAASALTHTGLFAPAMTNNQKSYLMFGKSASNNEAFYWAYNHNSTSSLRYLSLQSNLVAPGNNSLAMTADGNVGIGTVTPSQKLSILNTDNNGSANSLIDFTNNVALQGFIGTGSATTSNSDYRSNMVLSSTNNLFLTATSSAIRMRAGGITLANQIAKLKSNGIRVGPNDDTDPSAYLHFSAGTATAGTAPIRFTAGVIPSSAVSGDLSTNSNNDLFYSNAAAVAGKMLVVRLNSSAASTLTLATTYTHYVFTGTTSTWTLPAVAATESHIFYIKNRGSGSITLGTAAAANELYTIAATNTLTIIAGTAVMILSDGTYWMVE